MDKFYLFNCGTYVNLKELIAIEKKAISSYYNKAFVTKYFHVLYLKYGVKIEVLWKIKDERTGNIEIIEESSAEIVRLVCVDD